MDFRSEDGSRGISEREATAMMREATAVATSSATDDGVGSGGGGERVYSGNISNGELTGFVEG